MSVRVFGILRFPFHKPAVWLLGFAGAEEESMNQSVLRVQRWRSGREQTAHLQTALLHLGVARAQVKTAQLG